MSKIKRCKDCGRPLRISIKDGKEVYKCTGYPICQYDSENRYGRICKKCGFLECKCNEGGDNEEYRKQLILTE